MKFADLVLLRKKYVNYIFELCFYYFENPKKFIEEELLLKKHMDYDWMLQSQANKVFNQANTLNQRIREFSKFTQVDKKAMNELMNLKIILKNQKKSIELLQENHYKEIVTDYNKILLNLSSNIFNRLKEEEILAKMQLAIKKTEVHFIKYADNWRNEKNSYHNDIAQQTQFIIKNCEQIIQDINNSLNFDENDFFYKQKNNHLVSLQNSKITSNCNNLAHYVENFKILFPETLNYKEKEFYELNLKNEFKDFSNLGIKTIKDNPKIKEQLEKAFKNIQKTQKIFYELNKLNRNFLIKLEIEKKKLKKISTTENELTESTIKQWLEYDANGIFFLFSEYLKEHQLANDFFE